jgi:energy-converting hydrogenase Eha subunit C
MKILPTSHKIGIMLFVVASVIFAEVVIIGSPLWWIPTILYLMAFVFSVEPLVYLLWKRLRGKK